MRGNVDLVTPEGLVEGWCWDDEAPDNRVLVAIYVDGVECGRVVAHHYRKDLQDADIGDGGHFFRLLLPEAVLRQRRSQKVALVDPATGQSIGEPYTVRFEYGLRFDDRLSELEARSRLLESRLAELADGSEQRNASELFAVVGAFFQRLSEDAARGTISTSERQLDEAIRATTKALSPVVFPVAVNPTVTILVEANCPLGQLHRCLAALQLAAAGCNARVIILDMGRYDDSALVCGVVQGVQYLRASGDVVSECRNAVRSDSSDLLMLLSGYAMVDQAFLTGALQIIEQNAPVGVVGGCHLDAEGQLRPAAVRVIGERLVEGEVLDDTQSLGHGAVVFRRQAFDAVGGLDAVFGDELWAGIIDLCFRLRAQGWSITSSPSALFSLAAGREALSLALRLATPSRARDLLLHRWVLHSDTGSQFFAGHAAVVGEPDRMEEEMDAVRRLRTAGFSVHYLAPDGADATKVAALQRAGAHVTATAQSFSGILATLIFAASDKGGLERLNEETRRGARLVTGLPSLVSTLGSNGVAPLAVHG